MKRIFKYFLLLAFMLSSFTSMATDKIYKIATDTTYAPFEFQNEEGELVGIDMDLLDAIAKDQNFKYEVEVVGFAAALTSLETGQADAVMAGMTITDARKEKYDFADPYFDTGVAMGVRADSTVKSYEDLKGKNVAVKISTAGCAYAESIAEKYGFNLVYFEESLNMFQDVLMGNSEACFEDYPVLGYEISRGLEMKMPIGIENPSQYGVAVMKGTNKEFLEIFNKGLSNLRANGEYQKIVDTYISK
ncbi:transporter substrate-binding domain-containing protein [Fusobacterium mortiferum]|uniref:transporter substrate-binding domain-containing protein n=1 Tax=Fusobacterium mortiferum TaxID=850 RepID=UPI000E443848|nr:transporter substrate-binding domain-containing protein [Fusobacterium mortiferum]RGM99848.1 glutamine ABC transporter substrate-binding protein [Fusobacterium mortiferum]